MKHIWRTLIILFASALVVGATVLLTPTSGFAEGRRPARREQQTSAADGKQPATAAQRDTEGPPPGEQGQRRERGGRDGEGFRIFGIVEVFSQLLIVVVITIVFVAIENIIVKKKLPELP